MPFCPTLFRAIAETLRRPAADPKHLVRKLVSSRCCTPGVRRSMITAYPLHCAGRRIVGRPVPLVACRVNLFLPVRVPSRLFQRLFLEELKQASDVDQHRFFGRYRRPGRSGRIHCQRSVACRLSGLRQAAICRTRTGTGLSRPLYPSRSRQHRSRSRHVPMKDCRTAPCKR